MIVYAYDITENKNRTRLAKKLKDFGWRVQYSVFECDINKDELTKLNKITKSIIDEAKDSVIIYDLCEGCRKKIKTFGKEKYTAYGDLFII
ncbi:MAG: CRISPR-associated endoribonuclease Cas2 1 [Melioribacteraceae bacterium]|nr:MAG: CRISPR-associated endoribonuclease Cas2 1 [Melioribacteraceae bacterium]